MTNTIYIIKCSKGLSNKSSNGIMPKHKILTFKRRGFTLYINALGKTKGIPFFTKTLLLPIFKFNLWTQVHFKIKYVYF